MVDENGDALPWHIVYASLVPVEKLPLYHVCPGSIAFRVVVPGAPIECNNCWWGFLRDVRSLVLRKIDLTVLVKRIRMVKADVIVFDGCEPLINDWVYDALRALRLLGVKLVVKTCGLLSLERYKNLKGLITSIIVEPVTFVVRDAVILSRFSKLLEEVMNLNAIVEFHVLFDGSKRAEAMLADLASTVKARAAIHVIPLSDDIEDKAYRVVERVKSKAPFSYLYGDTSYTMTHTVCPKCGTVVVKRHEWGVRVAGNVKNGKLTCPSCGETLPLVACEGKRTPRALHREIVVL